MEGPEVDIMSRFHSVVAALDFSDSAADVLDAALTLAPADQGGHIHLIHIVPDPVPALWSDDLPQIEVGVLARSWTESAKEQLAELTAQRQLDPAYVTTAVAVGQPATEIASYAERHAADAVVLGSHGHGLVRRFLLGSVADKVVRQAPCAVLIVPHRTLRGAKANTPAAARAAAAGR
jgi:nucleotide-binding universal stress UspA family protein